MNNLQLVTLIVLVVLVIILVLLILQLTKKNYELKEALLSSIHANEHSLSKVIQDNFFKFQTSIFSQLDQSVQHNRFVYDELSRNSIQLTETVGQKLEEVKIIVDEKLHQTLENRLGHSFKQVIDSLGKVQQGLGEMQVLASGVGDLKRVLSNVKTRGILGEIQLGNILEQILTPEQYGINISTIPHSKNHVEFAIKFPGKNSELPYIWLPIDAKFPMDQYERLINAYELNEKSLIEKSKKDISTSIKNMANDINGKYVYPPFTTDFSIMFLPTESLYAEILRMPGLIMDVQKNHKVMIVGPNNLAAFLTSLRQGFKSIAIERRTDEVWKLLNIVKMEFSKFGDILDKTQAKILEANRIIETAGAKSRNIERKLNKMDKLEYLEQKSDT